MNLFCTLLLSTFLSLSAPITAHADQVAVEQESGSGSGSSGTGSTGTGSTGSTTSGTAGTGSAGSAVISVPCLREDRSIANGTPEMTCASILPKCSDLRNGVNGVGGFERTVKEMLSMKIWGYYNGKDLDLDRSTPTNLQGTAMPTAMCSVVGSRLQNANGSNSTFELKDQKVGRQISCGVRPDAQGHEGSGFWGGLGSSLATIGTLGTMGGGSGNHLTLEFNNGAGSLWAAYMQGAYPWLIRKNAYDVLQELRPDLSNLNDVVRGNTALRADLSTLNTRMNTFYRGLSQELRNSCQTGAASLIDRCKLGTMSLTDPANRLCTLVKAQSAVSGGVLPNILIAEIMIRAQKQYDEYFSKLMMPGSTFNNFFNQCAAIGGNSDGTYGTSYRFKYSRTASCLFTGDWFLTYDDYSVHETTDTDGSDNRSGRVRTRVKISDGTVESADTFRTLLAVSGPGLSGGGTSSFAVNQGFAGFVEAIIRGKICGQRTYADVSVCDSVNIPDRPAGVR